MDQTLTTYWRVCENGICHCDFRYTIYGCEETETLKTLYIATAAILSALFAINLIVYFLNLNFKSTFIVRNGFPRPKPMESMAFFGLFFNGFLILQCIFIITDAIPSPTFRSFMHDFAFQFGYVCFVCYFFGVAFTLSDTSQIVYSNWVRSDKRVNILFLATLCVPFVTNITWAVLAGHYASQGDIQMARTMTKTQYYFWTFYDAFLASLLLWAGLRLLNVLKENLLSKSSENNNSHRIKIGAIRIKIIVTCGTIVLYMFAILLALYNSVRESVLTNTTANIAVTGIWLFIGPAAVFFVEVAIIMSPNVIQQFSHLSFNVSSHDLITSEIHNRSSFDYSINEKYPRVAL